MFYVKEAIMGKLILPVGVPGSGKSTAGQKNQNALVLSSDAIRGELFGDEAIQYDEDLARKMILERGIALDGMTEEEIRQKKQDLCHMRVFEILNERVHQALKEGKDVIYDATNLRRSLREHVLDEFRGEYDSAEAWFFDLPVRIAIRRNDQRDRKVPRRVIRQMHRGLQRPSEDEGFDRIVTIRP